MTAQKRRPASDRTALEALGGFKHYSRFTAFKQRVAGFGVATIVFVLSNSGELVALAALLAVAGLSQ